MKADCDARSMKVSWGLSEHRRAPYPVLTVGNFDGQHLGHRALLRAVVGTARAKGGTAVVLTFQPHPVTVLAPAVELRLLSTFEEKLQRLEQAGIQEVVIVEFTPAFAALSPDAFVTQVLRDGIGVRELFVGEHFAFGKGRAGTLADLVRWSAAAGFEVHPVPPVRVDGEVISSSRIRRLLQAGEVRGAARCLGRPYTLSGVVTPGEQRGRSLGWPTANLRLPSGRVIPPDGVYATRVRWNERTFDAASYLGRRPTFGPGERLLEVYLLVEQVCLYDQMIQVQFIERVREDRTFATPEALSAQIGQDVRVVREALKAAAELAIES